MIVFDDSEHRQSPIEEDTLRILLNFLPREAYDKLFIRQVRYVRSHNRTSAHAMEKRIQLNRVRNCRLRIIETKSCKETVEAVYPVAVGG